MKRIRTKIDFSSPRSTLIPVTLCVMAATLSVLNGCAKKKDAPVSKPAEAAPAPVPVPAPPKPEIVASAPGAQEDIPYEDMQWMQHLVDPIVATYQADLTAPAPVYYDTHPDEEKYDTDGHDLDEKNQDLDSDARWEKQKAQRYSDQHGDHFHQAKQVSQPATITIGKMSVPARTNALGKFPETKLAYYLHFYSNGPLGRIEYSRFLERHWQYEGIMPWIGKQTRLTMRTHMFPIPELSNKSHDEDTSFKIELQYALVEGNSVDPAQTRLSILSCVPNSSGYKRCKALPSVKLKLRGGRR